MNVAAVLLFAVSVGAAALPAPAAGSSPPVVDSVLARAALALDPLRAADLAATRAGASPGLARIDPRDAATRKRKGIRRKVRIV